MKGSKRSNGEESILSTRVRNTPVTKFDIISKLTSGEGKPCSATWVSNNITNLPKIVLFSILTVSLARAKQLGMQLAVVTATMTSELRSGNPTFNRDALASITDLQEYGAKIVDELDRAEADLDNADNQPFSGMSEHIMSDIAHLRNRQFDMYKRHVEIEQSYKIHTIPGGGGGGGDGTGRGRDEHSAQPSSSAGVHASSSTDDIHRTTFSSIAATLRQKESATANLLNKLADFDAQLRSVLDKFELSRSTGGTTPISLDPNSKVHQTHQAQGEEGSLQPHDLE